ncbi:hypothetical protein [Noviherbaspirillum agri]
MQDAPIRLDEQEDRCDPQWIQMNHLFSYCAKSLSSPSAPPSGSTDKPSGDRRCRRGSCVFSFRRH